MKNITAYQQPILPAYTLIKEPDLLSFVSDKTLGLLIPVVSYAILAAFWVWIDSLNIWTEYRLHPTEEMLKRNRITKWECLRGVSVYFVVTGAAAVLLSWGDPMETFSGDEAYRIARIASYLRSFQAAVPVIFSLVGIDSKSLAERQLGLSSTLAGILKGGVYPQVAHHTADGTVHVSSFMPWETTLATILFYVAIPVIQFIAAFFIADTWFYFMHRFFHSNKWLYKNLHAVHHRLYVTYAYGALYAHPIEGLAIDTIAFTLGIIISGLTPRQAMVYNFLGIWKAMSDHCGYVLPWDPFNYITGNNGKYHDVHHQTWGLKNNYALYFTFWDRLFDTERIYEEQEKKHAQIINDAKKEMKIEHPEVAKELLAAQ